MKDEYINSIIFFGLAILSSIVAMFIAIRFRFHVGLVVVPIIFIVFSLLCIWSILHTKLSKEVLE